MIDLSAGFKIKCKRFPSITPGARVQIPKHLHSQVEPSTQARCINNGALEAVCLALTGRVQLAGNGLSSVTISTAGAEGPKLTRVDVQGAQYTWVRPGAGVRPFLALLVEALVMGEHEELRDRYRALISALGQSKLPLQETDLASRSHDAEVRDAMMALNDSLYYHLKAHQRGVIDADIPEPADSTLTPVLYGRQPGVRGPTLVDASSRLSARLGYGVRALLVGPTGCGKTEQAKRAALSVGARMVPVKGREGMEDRDLIGFVSVSPTGPRWVDGPVARAMRLAMSGERVVLVIDELMRFNPYHRNMLVGLMDELSAEEVAAVTGARVEDGKYYLLELPGNGTANGDSELLIASAALLSVICTTNVGGRYTQSQDFDPALKRRFELILPLSYPEAPAIMPVYERVGGPVMAPLAYALELATREMTTEKGQLLADPMNIGVTLNYLREAQSLCAAGLAPHEALKVALHSTVVPYCCELIGDGTPDPAAVKSLETTLEHVLRRGVARAA